MIDNLHMDNYPGSPSEARWKTQDIVFLAGSLALPAFPRFFLVWTHVILSLDLLIQDDIMVHYAQAPNSIIQSINFSLFFVSV